MWDKHINVIWRNLWVVSHLLNVLRYEASSNFFVTGDEEESFGLRGTLGLHLLEAEVIVHHLPDLLHLRDSRLLYHQERGHKYYNTDEGT